MSTTSIQLDALRAALLALPSSGPEGFEGLLAKVLAKTLGIPFRLAKSGAQFGVDGKASDPTFPVAFEAKRYRDEVPSSEVLYKIATLAIRGDPLELWVLGTTGVVSTQVADDLEAFAAINGFTVLILDWQPDAPRLAAVLTAAYANVCEFLLRSVHTEALAPEAIAQLEGLSRNTNIAAVANLALNVMRTASSATPIAREANRNWLIETLSNRIKSKSRLGQALAPLDSRASLLQARRVLLDEIQAALAVTQTGRLVAVLGDEGNGKTWVSIKACVDHPMSPLVIVFSPEEFVRISEGENWDEVLARKLLAQTQETDTVVSRKRWSARFTTWRNSPPATYPRMLVLVDGLNQRPSVNWGRHLDSLVLHISELGGCTVATCRMEYFRWYVEPRLYAQIATVHVPPWTAAERDQVLASKGILSARLQPAVANSLLNPRLLGIALTMLDADTLEGLEALSVPWLLFEHLRMLDRERTDEQSALKFAGMLQGHANELLSRVRSPDSDDVTVFDNLEPAAEGRFFQWVQGDPLRYRLSEQGLTYALGLAVIEELRRSVRNGRDVQETLNVILEPIAALDQTADAIFAALTIACVDQNIADEIGVALLVGFAKLQNPDDALFSPFAGLARRRVLVFCKACELLWMTDASVPNADWLRDALQAAKRLPGVWKEMLPFLNMWLRYWWPDARVEDKVKSSQGSPIEERRHAEAERDQRFNGLSQDERDYLNALIRRDQDSSRLIRLALQLCAGMPLEGLSHSLACASFSMALIPTLNSPHDELCSLIQFNRRDWPSTRDQLVNHTARLAASGTSVVGRWAAVSLLRATGGLADSAQAQKLFLDLTKDRDLSSSWRQVESYCATDPCDPNSCRPANIDVTVLSYGRLEVDKLRLFMGMNEHDHFAESALPGLARFAPATAVSKRRELLFSILARSGLPLRQAAWTALDDAALIDRDLATRLQALGRSFIKDHAGVDEVSAIHVQQALLLASFPMLSPQEQFEGVDAISDPNSIWLDLLRLAKVGSPTQLTEELFSRDRSELRVAIPLVLAGRLDSRSIPGFAKILPELLANAHPIVRSGALHLASVTPDAEALMVVVNSGCSYRTGSRLAREYIAGSLALIEAAKRGLVPSHEVLARIAPECFGVASTELDDASVVQIAAMLDVCVRSSAGIDIPVPSVAIVLTVTRSADVLDARHSLQDEGTEHKSFAQTLRGMSEDAAGFKARQQRLREAYDAFVSHLTPQTAAVVMGAFQTQEINAILRVAPDLAYSWSQLLRDTTRPHRPAIRNFGMCLASAMTHGEKSLEGVELLTLLRDGKSFVNVRYTLASMPLEAVALWSAADRNDVNTLRFARLDACVDDQELAIESATAIYAGKSEILKAYVQDRLDSLLPVDVARGITVAGFSNDSFFASEIAERFSADQGLLGSAARACQHAMDRYSWSRHWFEQMLNASTGEEFWAASTLFLKVVDPRFEADHRDELEGTEAFGNWWWSVERRLQRRFDRWSSKRKRTLFGSKVPDSTYVLQGS